MDAVVPEEPVGDVSLVGVYVVEDCVGVAGVAGCEHDYLEVLAEFPQHTLHVGTDVYLSLSYKGGTGELLGLWTRPER